MKYIFVAVLLLVAMLTVPSVISAHEVYVLTSSQIKHDLHDTSLNVFASLNSIRSVLWFL